MEKKAGGDEHICTRTFGKWKCKDVSSDNKLQYSCSKRLTRKEEEEEKLKNTSGDVAAAGCSATGVETDQSLDETGGTHTPTADTECGSANVGTKRKIIQETEESGELDFLTENPPLIISNKMMKKNKEMEKKKKLPPDEQRCGTTGFGGTWRCKNFRMGHGAAAADTVPKTEFCEKHYIRGKYYENLKKRSRDGEGAVTGHTETEEDMEKKNLPQLYCCQTDGKRWRCKNLRMGLGAAGDDSVPKTRYCEKHYKCRLKSHQKYFLKKRSGDAESAGCTTATGLVEIRSSKRTKKVTEEDETEHIQPATHYDTCSAKIGAKRKKVQNTERSGGLNSVTKIGEPVVEFQSLEHYKSKCFELSVELEKQKVELEKKNGEYTILQDKYAELETKKTAVEELSVELKKQKVELEKKNVEYTILQGKYAELETKKTPVEDVDAVKNRYISSKSLHLAASGGENVSEGKGWGCKEGRPFEHGSSSQAHLEMSEKIFVNLVSDSDDESVDSLGNPMDMLAMENWNRNKHEMKWKSEPELLSSFEEDTELCMKAVCALYRQEISEDEISPKGLVIDSDTLRCATLAKFLMNNDCKGDLKKSMAELEKFDSKAVGDCKKLARRYSMYLFDIYKNRKDPFFLPATTASNGDQSAK